MSNTASHALHWPVLKSYTGRQLARVAMPLGGIGTGSISLGGRGHLRDFEIVNRPAKGFRPDPCFFAVRLKDAAGNVFVKALEGPLDAGEYEGESGSTAANHGLPRFKESVFHAAYPLAQVELRDPTLPVDVRLLAFNPLVPCDSEQSGLPVAVIKVALTNRTDRSFDASVCTALANFIGRDGKDGTPKANVNTFRTGREVSGVFLTTTGLEPSDPKYGSLALTTTDTTADISYRTGWLQMHWNAPLLEFWDDFSDDGRLNDTYPSAGDAPVASLAVQATLGAGESKTLTFLLTWHFPNRLSWSPNGKGKWTGPSCENGEPVVGNHYARRFADAWAVAEQVAAELTGLEADTVSFVQSLCESDLPAPVKEAALFNLSTLRTETCFRTADGMFFGWEGIFAHFGSCLGSCTHVWNYEHTTAFLFADLARSMREVEYLHCTDDRGHMSFRAHLPLTHARGFIAAADGQMGCVMKLYRDWQLSGDDGWLRTLWPAARRSLEFCWIPGGWDADRDGVMEGCQHNTMDVEYFGPNAQMTGWYLGALRAASAIATHLGETDFAAICDRLFQGGSKWMDDNLFNGEYYEQHVRPPGNASSVAAGLRWGAPTDDLSNPDFQLGPACLVDQLVGQVMAHVCGLGYLHRREHISTTLNSILKYNRLYGFQNHFNNMRSYALGDETALLMASYPRGGRPKRPFPYATEVMTGFEYTAALGLLYEGHVDAGVKVIADIRDRYDGERRSPFDEAECGHHYARAMASWGAILALTGFHFSAVTRTMRFAESDGPANWFWSTGTAWGTVRQHAPAVTLSVLGGTIALDALEIVGRDGRIRSHAVKVGHPLKRGDVVSFSDSADVVPA